MLFLVMSSWTISPRQIAPLGTALSYSHFRDRLGEKNMTNGRKPAELVLSGDWLELYFAQGDSPQTRDWLIGYEKDGLVIRPISEKMTVGRTCMRTLAVEYYF